MEFLGYSVEALEKEENDKRASPWKHWWQFNSKKKGEVICFGLTGSRGGV